MPVHQGLLDHLRAALKASGDSKDAIAMQAYMKSPIRYAGVKKPARRAILSEGLRRFGPLSWSDARDSAATLFRDASVREERYFALTLTRRARYRSFLRNDELPLFEEMLVAAAWWDLVDEIATYHIGAMLEFDPKPMRQTLLDWSVHQNLWKRRASIIAQLKFKERTDTELLRRCIEANLGRKEFWLRKANGWALRQFSKTDPGWVAKFVSEHEEKLSGLAKREARKYC